MRMTRGVRRAFLSLFVVCTLAPVGATEAGKTDDSLKVDFGRDIRPILSDNCFVCHGPDEAQRQVDLRLDTQDGVFGNRGGYSLVVPGEVEKSRLFQRITAPERAARMPPPWANRELTDEQVGLIRRWIEQGAKWQVHWAFVRPRRLSLPEVVDKSWPRNPIDFFVLGRLEMEGVTPSAEAQRSTLIRRVTLDLTGLPPTLSEINDFLADQSANAYEKVVDRLLQSPRYGERMAWRWLELARYADTNGYQTDGERYMWRWRDWIIDAFNANMPFDQFTVEQIAGDMLPDATLNQKIASGFNRNHRGNGEGGIIPEEYAVEYVVDRVDTTSTVWLGQTMGCARCHDHKYDPFTQKEFYQFYGYFNNIPEKGKAIKHGNSPPMIKAPTPAQEIRLEELRQKAVKAEENFVQLGTEFQAAQTKWESSLRADEQMDWSIETGLSAHYSVDGATQGRSGEGPPLPRAEFRNGELVFGPGRLGQAIRFDGSGYLEAGDVADFGYLDRFSLGAWIFPENDEGVVLAREEDSADATGYSIVITGGKLRLYLSNRRLDDALRVETRESLAIKRWHHIMVTYDGTRMASGVKVYLNGRLVQLNVLFDDLNQSFSTRQPLRIGSAGGSENRFQGLIDDVRIYSVVLSQRDVEIVATPESISEIAALEQSKRSSYQSKKISAYFLDQYAPEGIQLAWRELLRRRTERDEFYESIPTSMVMQEMENPRDTFVLVRGAYDKPGAQVNPGVPAILPPLPPGVENNRLGLARWLVDPSNPLTARVTVNRFWQMYFGAGLVRTVENFGSQGEPPSHSMLLDWLAAEFMGSGWDVKSLQKIIVMSATYRQSSREFPELLEKDPGNRLLARGPRFRLSAEMVRDQALAMSGLLVEQVGGPSVRPYQPEGLWKELSGGAGYKPDKGDNLYRRSLYTFWKRTIPPPSMTTFDAATREFCEVRETRTNTPLQALVLMNDVTYVESARVMAERVMKEGGANPSQRLIVAFRLATGRIPKAEELEVLMKAFNHHLSEYRTDRKKALLLIDSGESVYDKALNPGELAAYTIVTSMILNLDETLTKE